MSKHSCLQAFLVLLFVRCRCCLCQFCSILDWYNRCLCSNRTLIFFAPSLSFSPLFHVFFSVSLHRPHPHSPILSVSSPLLSRRSLLLSWNLEVGQSNPKFTDLLALFDFLR